MVAGTCTANEKFYPIIGPDGNIQVIHGFDPTTNSKSANPSKVDRAQNNNEAPSEIPLGGSKPTQDSDDTSVIGKYDSESYIQSEVLDEAVARDKEKKKFYFINDVMGSRLNNVDESDDEFKVSALVQHENYTSLRSKRISLDADEAVRRFPGLPRCLEENVAIDVGVVKMESPASLILNRQTYHFLPANRALALYRIEGRGLRTIVSGSFSRGDRKPAFVIPYLAFFDAHGCMTRLVYNYFDRLYPATDRTHPELEADLMVHSEESYLLVVAPSGKDSETVASLPYEPSEYGQLLFSLKK